MKIQAKQLWNFQTEDALMGIRSEDITDNGQNEIIAHSKSGKVFIFSSGGKLLFEDTIIDNASIWCSEFYDLTGDGKKNIILGGYDGLLRTFSFDGAQLEAIWAHRFGGSISGILINDINNNDENELIVYSLDQSLRVLKPSDGSLIWGQMFEEGIGEVKVWEGEGTQKRKEIYAAGNDHTIRAFNGEDGALLWFKRFENKVRCIDYIHQKQDDFIVCGGDDKQLHFIRRTTQDEIKTMTFDDYAWKTLGYPPEAHKKMIVSTYSFAYFDETVSIKDIDFTSKVLQINNSLEIEWEIPSKNIECLRLVDLDSSPLIAAGTTKGEFLFINPQNGEIELTIPNESCLNSFSLYEATNTLYTAHDNGVIYVYQLES